MKAKYLISEYIPPIKYTETGEKALKWMNEFRVSHLPVLHGREYVGIISDDDIYDMVDPKHQLKEEFINLPKPFVYSNQHVYDIMKIIADAKITVVPILDEHNNYLGCTDLLFLMSQIVSVGSIRENGSIIVLTMGERDYSLTEIARICEENNAKVLSSYVNFIPDSTEIQITLKIHATNLEKVIRTFERYDYNITETYSKGDYSKDLSDRYDELMNYLNM
ncbi:MAG: CBS domain-containing protein [Putridiphycobacter sp.]